MDINKDLPPLETEPSEAIDIDEGEGDSDAIANARVPLDGRFILLRRSCISSGEGSVSTGPKSALPPRSAPESIYLIIGVDIGNLDNLSRPTFFPSRATS